jgi:transposase-like protein
VTKALNHRERVVTNLEIADRSLRRACARAVREGVPLRAIATYAGVSHVTVRKWVESVTDAELESFAGLDGYRVVHRNKPLPGRPGLSGRRSQRKR